MRSSCHRSVTPRASRDKLRACASRSTVQQAPSRAPAISSRRVTVACSSIADSSRATSSCDSATGRRCPFRRDRSMPSCSRMRTSIIRGTCRSSCTTAFGARSTVPRPHATCARSCSPTAGTCRRRMPSSRAVTGSPSTIHRCRSTPKRRRARACGTSTPRNRAACSSSARTRASTSIPRVTSSVRAPW
jgi:hypothetical protein